jgi:hypothetical protein
MYRPNVAAPSHGLPDEQAHAPAPAAKPAGARPRPEVPAVKGKAAPHPQALSLGKGALDAGKAQPRAQATAKQKTGEGDGKPDPGWIVAPAKKSAPKAAAPAAKPAAKAAPVAVKQVAKRDVSSSGLHQTTWAPPGTRHPAGLAIDVGLLRKRDGRWESADLGVFTYVLTPDYNPAHADHFHMEIKPGVKWFLYH